MNGVEDKVTKMELLQSCFNEVNRRSQLSCDLLEQCTLYTYRDSAMEVRGCSTPPLPNDIPLNYSVEFQQSTR